MLQGFETEILSIGTELLTGETGDTNAGFIAAQLRHSGVLARRITAVGDDPEELRDVLAEALGRSKIIISSGGLGPTADDITRECIAAALTEELYVDADLKEGLTAFFKSVGREMPASNLKQATLIPSARPIRNERGTAPGWWVEKDGRVVIALPGPPREMMAMWSQSVAPGLARRLPAGGIETATVKLLGMSEAAVSDAVREFFEVDNPSLGIYAKPDGIHLRLIARGDNSRALLRAAEAKLEAIFSGSVWGKGADTLPLVIARLLGARGQTLATVEDGSRGALANLFCAAPEFRARFRGGAATPGDPVQANAATAEAMARRAREQFGADIGLSTGAITGITPGAETPRPSLYIGIADEAGVRSWCHQLLPRRDEAADRAATAALLRLRQTLLEAPGT